MIAYASMYGNTEAAAQALAAKLCEKGMSNVWVYDVSNTHVSQLVSEAFRLSHLVFGQTQAVPQDRHVLHLLLQELLHQIPGLHGPGAVLDDGAGALLEVQGLQVHQEVVQPRVAEGFDVLH